ncbi:MAG TPA: YkvA family protein [Intrasporangium sp.]|jgi:Uncharacterized conserved protein|uniref:YkvA family protein n=1 Tax=Intrasporangium sp. TaxID=1925024 RepID=UPI002F940DA6
MAGKRLKLIATVASVVRASTRPGAPSLSSRVQAVPRLVRATLSGRYVGTTRGRLGLLAGAVAYIVSPVDLVPEAVLPVLGTVDDAFVISWAIKTLVEETDRFLAWEAGEGRGGSARGSSRPIRGGVVVEADGADGTGQGTRDGGGTASADHRQARATGAGPRPGVEARQAATNYVLETVRKRLER